MCGGGAGPAAAGPLLQLFQLFARGAGQGHQLGGRTAEISLAELTGFAEGLVHRLDHHLLELGSREPLGPVHDNIEGDLMIRPPAPQLQIKDRSPFLAIG